MRKIVIILLIIGAGYIGYQKFFRKPTIKAENLAEVIIYGDYGKDKKVTFLMEIADDPFERQKGLMYRESLAKDKGMLFVFKRSGRYPMTMKNTYIPLDMIYIDSSHRIVEIVKNAEPETDGPYGGNKRASYVMEVKAGSIEKYGIKVGNVVKGLSKRGN